MYIMTLAATSAEEVMYGYGPLGVAVVALAVFSHSMIRMLIRDRDKAIDERNQLLEDMTTKVIPAIIQNTAVLERRQSLDHELLEVIKVGTAAFERNSRLNEEVKYVLRHGRHDSNRGEAV